MKRALIAFLGFLSLTAVWALFGLLILSGATP